MATFTHADDWSWGKMTCSACGASITAEDLPSAVFTEKRMWRLTKLARTSRKVLEDQLATWLHKRGCGHV